MSNQKRFIILIIVLILSFLFSLYSLYTHDGSVVVDIFPNQHSLSILLFNSLIASLLPTGILHIIFFLRSLYYRNGNVIMIIFAIFFLPITTIIGMITVIPYMIYLLVRILNSIKAKAI